MTWEGARGRMKRLTKIQMKRVSPETLIEYTHRVNEENRVMRAALRRMVLRAPYTAQTKSPDTEIELLVSARDVRFAREAVGLTS